MEIYNSVAYILSDTFVGMVMFNEVLQDEVSLYFIAWIHILRCPLSFCVIQHFIDFSQR